MHVQKQIPGRPIPTQIPGLAKTICRVAVHHRIAIRIIAHDDGQVHDPSALHVRDDIARTKSREERNSAGGSLEQHRHRTLCDERDAMRHLQIANQVGRVHPSTRTLVASLIPMPARRLRKSSRTQDLRNEIGAVAAGPHIVCIGGVISVVMATARCGSAVLPGIAECPSGCRVVGSLPPFAVRNTDASGMRRPTKPRVLVQGVDEMVLGEVPPTAGFMDCIAVIDTEPEPRRLRVADLVTIFVPG